MYGKYPLLIGIHPVSSFPSEHGTIVYGIHFPSMCIPRINFHLQAITKIPIISICIQSANMCDLSVRILYCVQIVSPG